jgi:hypothetical protein
VGSATVARVIDVAATSTEVADRVRLFARHNDFKPVEEQSGELVFKRGGGLGDLFSFDVHNVSTRFVVTLERRGAGTRVTATMKAGSPFQVFTGGDRAALERNIDVFVDMVRSTGESG